MSEKSKIAVMHVINAYTLGGAEKLVFDIASGMDKAKFDVFICSIGAKGDDIGQAIRQDLQSRGIKTLSLDKAPRKQRWSGVLRLADILRKHKIDIVHTHCPSPDFYGRFAASLNWAAVVVSTIHNTAGYSRLSERILGRFVSKYIAISEAVQKYALDDLQLPAHKVVVIHNGIRMETFQGTLALREEKLAELGISGNKKIIISVGRIAEAKGQFYLIQAAKGILKVFPDTHFVIVGSDQVDKALAQELKRVTMAEGLAEHITFAGVRQDVPELLAISDVFVLPSLWEGFALVSLEAMAAGVPMVATDVGSIREILVNRENGLIVPPKDAEALADGIKFMLADPERARAMGLEGKKSIMQKFTIGSTVRRYEELYLKSLRKDAV